jgi:endoglucanase
MAANQQKKSNRIIGWSVGIILIGSIGMYLLSLSDAATPTVSFEAESGTLSGAAKISDTSASGSSAVRFTATTTSGAPWGAKPLFSDPANTASTYARNNPSLPNINLIARAGQQPVATWFGGWNSNVQTDARNYVTKAAAAGAVPIMVAYNVPNRDCGGYSGGGAQTEAEYATWITQLASGIGTQPAIVVLEPDAVALISCLNADQLAARWRALSNAVTVLRRNSSTYVYIDAGHSGWLSAADTANRLKSAGIASATGFALNVSNFTTTASNLTFGNQVAALVGNKHYVIDTSRNGNGPTADGQWCNPPGRAYGLTPRTTTGSSLADAYLWIKIPWQSDGNCNGAPPAGSDNWPYAIALAQAAGW